MFEEHGLHSAIRDGADLRIIGWIQVQEREEFESCNDVKGIAGLYAVGAGNRRSFDIEFDTKEPGLCVAGSQMQRSFLSYAGTYHRSPPNKAEQTAKLHSLALRSWVATYFPVRDIPHGFTLPVRIF
jgi:hypothetical protein